MTSILDKSRALGRHTALHKLAYTGGVNATGAWDASANDPSHAQRVRDAVSRGFSVNENQVDYGADQTSDMSEPGTMPAVSKIAAGLGISAPVKPMIPAAMKPVGAAKIKPMQGFDPRTDKPQGYNLTHGVQTVSNGADVGNSYTAFSRRLQGNPG